jgi:hypothetical protein
VSLLLLSAALLGVAVSAPAKVTGEQSTSPQTGPVQVFGPFTPTEFAGDLRRLPQPPAWQPGDPIKEIPRRHLVRTEPERPPEPRGFGIDPLAALQARAPQRDARTFSSSTLNFEGMGYQFLNPPDPVGDVGRDYYIQMINGNGGSLLRFHDKATGTVITGPVALDSLGSGSCATGAGDPIVLYDHLADRWLLSEFSGAGNVLCVYVSQTSDPVTGGWYLYAFATPNFPNYPKYAVWPDGYYVSTNESSGPAVYVLDREAMLSGQAATSQRFTAVDLSGFGFQALTPADLDGDREPSPGAPGIFMRHRDTEIHGPPTRPLVDYLEIFELHVDWDTPANTTFVQTDTIAVAEFDSTLCGQSGTSCFPQPSGSHALDPLREVIMWRLPYRNFGTHEVLLGNFVTDVSALDDGAVRWFELRRQPVGVGNWTLYQEGTYSYSLSVDRWMGSIAMDGEGNIALGFNFVNDVATYASLGLTGRLATDPLGVFTASLTTVATGAGSNSSNRYGDYNSMSLDPVDDCTFWFTGEYNPSSQWGTRIATFRYATCPGELELFIGDEEAPAPAGDRR